MTRLLLALLLPLALFAQTELLVVQNNTEQPAGTSLDVGRCATSDICETHMRFRYTGTARYTVQAITIKGSGFSLIAPLALPYVMTPKQSLDFLIRFVPNGPGFFSANLAINDLSTIVRGTAYASATLSLEENGRMVALRDGSPIDMGRVERGSTANRKLVFENPGTDTVPLPALTSTGASFRLSGEVPATLGPRGAAAVDVVFAPVNAGAATGTLVWQGRTFILSGVGLEPPFPLPKVEISETSARTAQQLQVRVRLAKPSPRTGTGTLRMELKAANGTTRGDSALQFVSTGTINVPFSVREGDESVRFGDREDATLQTGTLAGTLTVSAALGDFVERTTLVLASAPPVLDSAETTRTGSSLTVRLKGYDNTQSATRLQFTFYDRNNTALSTGPVGVDAKDTFQQYFATTTSGGTFALQAVFPITGDAGQISGVTVEVTNGIGRTVTERLRFP